MNNSKKRDPRFWARWRRSGAVRIPDLTTVEIPQCGLYAKSPEALAKLFKELGEMGYEIKDCSKGEIDHRPPRSVQEKEGWYLWYASLREVVCERKGKCDSCGSYIDVRGIQTHKHKCEKCGAYTYLQYVDGSVVRFKFLNDENGKGAFEPTLQMKVFDYDDELGCLLVYPTPLNGNNFNDWNADNAMKVLERNKSKFKHVERNGKNFLAIHYNPYSIYIELDAVISMYDSHGHKWNHKIVKLYKGQEFSEWDKLPVPESYAIYEAWHWSPLKPSRSLHEKIIHAAGMVSDCGYYYQDGRTAFYDVHLERMRLYVEHFTTIPIDKWDAMIRRAPKSGPGMIKTLAAFCQGVDVKKAAFENKPNIGNLLAGFSKAMGGKKLTDDEKTAMFEAAADREIRDDFLGVLGHKRTLNI